MLINMRGVANMKLENVTSHIIKNMTIWLWGGFIYYLIELAWRGHSHPSMFIVGGLCLIIVSGINDKFPWDMPLALQCFIGGIVITLIELITGCIVNLWLGWGVWDYSSLPLNVLGQVSLPFILAWIGLALVCIYVDDYLRWKLYGEERPRYKWFSSDVE